MNVNKMATACIWLSGLIAAGLATVFWGDWLTIVGLVLAIYPFAMFLGLIAGFAAKGLGIEFVLDDDDEDDVQVWTDEKDIIILDKSKELVGLFQNEPIHEWVTLQRPDNGEPIRCVYSQIIDMRSEYNVTAPEKTWFCILAPGIMYVADELSPI
jgi:hypothetical protein